MGYIFSKPPPTPPIDPDRVSSHKIANETDYDPHEHRVLEAPVSDWASLMHLVKGALGTGILSMPKAFTYTGWLLGLVTSFVVTFLCTYGLLMAVHAKYVLCRRQRVANLTYPDAFRLSLGFGPKCMRCLQPIASYFVNTFLLVYQLGICAIYIVFLGTTTKTLIESFSDLNLNLRIYALFFFIPLLAIISIKDLKRLVPFSTVANCMMAIGICIVLYFVFTGLDHKEHRDMVLSPLHIPQFISICLFALEAVGLIMTVENNMATPKSFGGPFGVFAKSMTLVGALYAFLGLVGYLRYGEHVASSIVFNLDEKGVASRICKAFLVVAVYISFGVQGYVIVDIAWNENLKAKFGARNRSWLYEYGVRYGIVVVSFILAMGVSKLDILIGFVGALCLSLLGFVVPGTMDICVRHPDMYGRYKVYLVRDILIILFGFFVLILGVTLNLIDLIETYN